MEGKWEKMEGIDWGLTRERRLRKRPECFLIRL